MKKPLSIVLAAAMIFSSVISASAAQTQTVTSADPEETATYYFLAPDNYFKTEAGAVNEQVDVYYWDGGGNGEWPGQAMTPAPEVHENAFKVTIPNNEKVGTVIFNAAVNAGDDAELKKAAHQTVNIDVEAANYDGMIYVLAMDDEHTTINEFESQQISGDWFSLDTFEDSDNYKTYGFPGKATYYFLAPDNYFKTEAGAANEQVDVYYWDNGGNGDWPGAAMEPAPEVHPNAFKTTIPDNDNVGTIIFNAAVNAGDDEELKKKAHQTVNIDVEAENYDGMIYVLDLAADKTTDEFSGAATSSGSWFTLDTFKSSDNYLTYDFPSTYYFLAPDNYFKTDAGAANDQVDVYYWDNGGNGDWPGVAMEPAPEVHPNAFKTTVPNNNKVATIIFNAAVNAGDDEELKKVAYQTVNIDVESENYDGKIYVLDIPEVPETAELQNTPTSGDWFSLDTFKDSANYKTYKFPEATYYFLAPDNYFKKDAGAVNEQVDVYYWDNGGNGDWPGAAMTPAPSVHPNAFKVTVPDNDHVGTIIFNAAVNAGDDAELKKAAHQTVNIDVEANNYDGMIYVLAMDAEHTTENEFGSQQISGDWFALDAFKSSDNYKTYGFAEEEATATYYFLAPDNYFKTEAGAVNDQVDVYYWDNGGNGDWPGAAMTPAPEVHPNAFKTTIPNNDKVGTIIFNAAVNAGDDAELKKAAHQTVNIDVEAANYDGMIYVLAIDDEHTTINEFESQQISGDWFPLDTFKDSDNFKTYSGTQKTYKAGDFVSADLAVGGVDAVGSVSAKITYNPEYLEIVNGLKASDDNNVPKVLVNEKTKGTINIGALYDGEKGTDQFKGDKVSLANITFKVLKDANDKDLAIASNVTRLAQIKDGKVSVLVKNNEDADKYAELTVSATKEHKKGELVTAALEIGGLDKVGSVSAKIFYDPEYLEITAGLNDEQGTDVPKVLVNEKTKGTINIGAVYDAENGTDKFKGDKTAVATITFKALKDFNMDELGLSDKITRITVIKDGKVETVVRNVENEDAYTNLNIAAGATKKVMVGDATGDEKIMADDSLKILRASVKLEEVDTIIGDVDNDNAITSADSLAVLRASVKLFDKSNERVGTLVDVPA